MADLIDRQAMIKRHCEGCSPDVIEACKEDPICGTLMWLLEEPAADAVEVGSCEGCIYANRKRPQKCSCCRRNRYLKDCYEEGGKE